MAIWDDPIMGEDRQQWLDKLGQQPGDDLRLQLVTLTQERDEWKAKAERAEAAVAEGAALALEFKSELKSIQCEEGLTPIGNRSLERVLDYLASPNPGQPLLDRLSKLEAFVRQIANDRVQGLWTDEARELLKGE